MENSERGFHDYSPIHKQNKAGYPMFTLKFKNINYHIMI